jgi:hypothetical protein
VSAANAARPGATFGDQNSTAGEMIAYGARAELFLTKTRQASTVSAKPRP